MSGVIKHLFKLITVVGARPQFIKAAVLSPHLENLVVEKILHTGQHYDPLMSSVFFEQLKLKKPSWHLECKASKHGAMTGKMMESIEQILEIEMPNAVLLYGDTNSTLAGALAAAKLKLPIWHVESGVRSFNKDMPEEINRVVTDQLSHVHFAPSETACENLAKEGIRPESIHNVGDLMCDLYRAFSGHEKEVVLPFHNEFLLLTLHRAENFETREGIQELFDGLNQIAKFYTILFPVHPRVKKILQEENFYLDPNIILREPLDYFEMLYVLNKCRGVLTDSGGLQKEAFYASKPCVTIRQETEWVELLTSGWNMLLSGHGLCSSAQSVLSFFETDFTLKTKENFYGTGNAAHKIKKIIEKLI